MSLSDEMALLTKLRALEQPWGEASNPMRVFEGLKTQAERRELVRVMVEKVKEVTYSIVDGKRITMAQAFMRAYGCDL